MELVWAIALGVTLAAAAGFRAFLPLFVLGVMQRYDLMGGLSLGDSFQWLSSDTAMLCLSVATILEVIADKLPALDSALDALMTVVRPAAGCVSVLAILSPQDPVVAYVSGIVLAGGTTLPIHLGKSLLRVGANVLTGGAAAPVLSAVEDVSATGSVVLAVAVPICAVLLGLGGLALTVWVWRRIRRRKAEAR
jgi:hypothetical protein